MFLFVNLAPPTKDQLRNLITSSAEMNGLSPAVLEKLFRFLENLQAYQRHLEDANKVSLSLRNILRVTRQLALNQSSAESNLGYLIDNVMMVPFLPGNTKDIVQEAKAAAAILSTQTNLSKLTFASPTISEDGSTLTINDLSIARRTVERPELVPNPLFYDNATQTRLLEKMLAAHKVKLSQTSPFVDTT